MGRRRVTIIADVQDNDREKLLEASGRPTADVDEIIAPQRLYLGSALAVRRERSALGITHVVNVAAEVNEMVEEEGCTNLRVTVADEEGALTEQILATCVDFIAAALSHESGRVMVHCFAGVSRSASVVVAFLMYAQEMSLTDAMATVKAKRSIVDFSTHQSSLEQWSKSREL